MTPFRLEPLGPDHDRAAFHCGEEALGRYFQTQVTQDTRRRAARCFVAVETDTGRITGFYTLSAAGLSLEDLPPDALKHLPRYPMCPAVRIGRLAVDHRFRKRGIGEALLGDAAARFAESDVAAPLLLVDAKNEQVATFYQRYGFRPMPGAPRTLFLTYATARKTLLQHRGSE